MDNWGSAAHRQTILKTDSHYNLVLEFINKILPIIVKQYLYDHRNYNQQNTCCFSVENKRFCRPIKAPHEWSQIYVANPFCQTIVSRGAVWMFACQGEGLKSTHIITEQYL